VKVLSQFLDSLKFLEFQDDGRRCEGIIWISWFSWIPWILRWWKEMWRYYLNFLILLNSLNSEMMEGDVKVLFELIDFLEFPEFRGISKIRSKPLQPTPSAV
jgi:hypothetical protein